MSAKNTWNDITSYSRNDAERIPSVFEAKSGHLSICVLNSHVDYRPGWVMHCDVLRINTRHLPHAKTAEEAKKEALTVVYERLDDLIKAAVTLYNQTILSAQDYIGPGK